MATAGVLVVNPVAAAPLAAAAAAGPETRQAAVELSAFENPLLVLQGALSDTSANLNTLGGNVVTQWSAVASALRTPAVQADLAYTLRNAVNPVRTVGATIGFPGKYGPRILEGVGDIGTAAFNALAALVVSRPSFDTGGNPIIDPDTGEQVIRPAVLPLVAGLLAQGKIVEAFGELNYWFLVDGLLYGRAASLDLLRIPGDFMEDLGFDTIARVLGTSWMTTVRPDGEIDGPGLFSRGVIGNLGRALMGPAVTATFQTVEVVQAAVQALMSGNVVGAISELVNAPVKIMNAFVNGYVPDFLGGDDPTWEPGSGQTFPGLLSPQGTFDFFFAQLPQQIARALTFPRPTSAPVADIVPVLEDSTPAAALSARFSLDNEFVTVDVTDVTDAAEDTATEDTTSVDTVIEEATDEVVSEETEADVATEDDATVDDAKDSDDLDAKDDDAKDSDHVDAKDDDAKDSDDTDAAADAKDSDDTDAAADAKDSDDTEAKADEAKNGKSAGNRIGNKPRSARTAGSGR